MEINMSESDGVTLLVLNGRVDSNTADQMGSSLNEAIGTGGTQLVLDLQGVDYMSSAGLRQMVATLKKLQQKDGDLRLASPTERVKEVLQLSGLDSIFTIYESAKDAINSFQRSPSFEINYMGKIQRLTVEGRYENIPRVTEFVANAAQLAGLDDQAVFHCQLTVDEACTNIIEHSYGGEEKGDIRASVITNGDRFTISLSDNGTPFDPTKVPPPHIEKDITKVEPGGLGLHLMNKLMDEVKFEFSDGQNRLTLVKRIGPESE